MARTVPIRSSEPMAPDPLPAAEAGAVLEIVDTRHEFTEDGRMIVSGAVTNSGTSRARRPRVRISLTDGAGSVLDSTEVFVEPERIATGEQGRFEAVFAEPGQDVRIVFELAWIS